MSASYTLRQQRAAAAAAASAVAGGSDAGRSEGQQDVGPRTSLHTSSSSYHDPLSEPAPPFRHDDGGSTPPERPSGSASGSVDQNGYTTVELDTYGPFAGSLPTSPRSGLLSDVPRPGAVASPPSSQDKFGSSTSLSAYYLPGKFTTQHRTGSRRHRGGIGRGTSQLSTEASSSSLNVRGQQPQGQGAFPHPALLSPLSRQGPRQRFQLNTFSPPRSPFGNDGYADGATSPSKPHLSTSDRIVKRGAGREAWNEGAGGNERLGAGGYEDDDGINVGVSTDASGMGIPLFSRRSSSGRKEDEYGYDEQDPSGKGKRHGAGGWLFGGTIGRLLGVAGSGRPGERLRWNRFKWALIVANAVLMIYSIIGLIACILTWFTVWSHAEVVRVGNYTELALATTAAVLCFVSSIVGWCGILLNNRAFLSIYTLVLWISFAILVTPGYIAYKQRHFNLEGKINLQWSRQFSVVDRRRVQDSLSCCGYYSPFIEASASSRCYARSALPGCKGRYLRFERHALMVIYASAFAVVPAHLLVIVTSILGSNHVTYRFGKGLTPPAYRLNSSSAAAIKDQFAAQFADTYGPAALASLLSRTRLPHSESETPSSWPARRPSHVSLALAPSTSSPESSNSHASFVGGSGAGARKGGAQGHGHGKEQYPVPILDPVPPSAARAPAHASAHPQARAPISYAQGGLGSPFTQDVPAFASTVHAADDDEEDEEEEDDDDDDEEAEEEEAPKKARSDVSANPPELRRR